MEPVIQFNQVSWRRDGKQILHDIDWTVNPGEQWAILGLNGSGKTSILNIVMGYTYPTEGNVTVLGQAFGHGGNIIEMRQQIGYVSNSLEQYRSILNEQKAENVVLSGKFNSIGLYQNHTLTNEDRQRAREILDALHIGYVKDDYFQNLSSGEERRVLIARALMTNPSLLILDEPCSGLDVKAREEVLSIMSTITEKGCQLLYVTHYLDEIVPAITHVILIKDGGIVSQGPKKEILTDDLLSETYEIPIKVHWENDRPYLTVQNNK